MHYIRFFILILILNVNIQTVEAGSSGNRALLDYFETTNNENLTLFSPKCLHETSMSEVPMPTDGKCAIIDETVETKLILSDVTDSIYPQLSQELKNGDKIYYILNREFGKEGERFRFYTAAINTGGSGYFYSLQGFFEKENQNYELGVVRALGDRCNDGYSEFHNFLPDGFIFSTAATLFRILNPNDRHSWREITYSLRILGDKTDAKSFLESKAIPLPFKGYMPYVDIQNAALGCVGNIIHLSDTEGVDSTVAVHLYLNQIAQDVVNSRNEIEKYPYQNCVLEQLVTVNYSNYHWPMTSFEQDRMVPIEDWMGILQQIDEACPSTPLLQ